VFAAYRDKEVVVNTLNVRTFTTPVGTTFIYYIICNQENVTEENPVEESCG
jgi:hypothetical protein